MKNKFMDAKVAAIVSTIAEITALTSQDCPEEVYNQKRVQLNQLLIEALVGCEIGENKKGETTVKFNKQLPDKMAIAKIASAVDAFVGDVENPYLLKISGADPDSMEIPVIIPGGVAEMEKVTNKTVKAAMVETVDAWYTKPLDGKDCYMIAALGEKARKDANFKKAAIVGGVILLAAILGGVGYYFYTKKKTEEAEEAKAVDETEEVPTVEITDEEIPDEVYTDDEADVDEINVDAE